MLWILGRFETPDFAEEDSLRLSDLKAQLVRRLSLLLDALAPTYLTVRGPWMKPDDPLAYCWHTEGESWATMIVWSNIPTELRSKSGKTRIITLPCEVLLIDNRLVEHRYPEIRGPRWFFRALSHKRPQIDYDPESYRI